MKFLSSGMENQIAIDVKVKGEIVAPSSNLKGRLILDGVLLKTLDIPVDEATTYLIDLPEIDTNSGEVKTLRVQLSGLTPVGMFNFNSTYQLVDYLDIPIDYDTIRAKLGVLDSEVDDYELNLEITYIQSFSILSSEFFELRKTNSNLKFLFANYLTLVAALKTVPVLLVRLAKSDSTENGDFQRLANAANLQELSTALQNELDDILNDLTDYITDDTTFSPVFTFVTISPDAITGEE